MFFIVCPSALHNMSARFYAVADRKTLSNCHQNNYIKGVSTMEKFFGVREKGSTIRTEILAGITTFMAMAYILMTNAGIFSSLGEGYYTAIYIATAVSAVVGTLLIAFVANLPLAQASGMGLNAFFVYTVCLGLGFTYANALTLVLFDGLLFVILTVTGLRKIIFNSIPKAVKIAIPAGIGLFIAFVGLQNAGIVVKDSATAVNLSSFNVLAGVTWADIMPKIVTILSVALIAVLAIKKVRGAVLWGILGGSAVYYLLGLSVNGFYANFFDGKTLNPLTAFADFFNLSFGKVFTEGFDYSAFLANHSTTELILAIVTTALAFCMVDMFDTLGTLYGACSRGNMLTKDGDVPNMDRAMLSDAIATVFGAVCGTSTVTTFVESSAGVAEGGRTGLSALVTSGMFFVAMFLCPIAALIPSCATAAALIYVGILMMSCVKEIAWDNPEDAVPAFFTLAMMPFTYNISYGIAFGLSSHILIKIFSGKIKDINVGTWVIGILFVLMFFLTH